MIIDTLSLPLPLLASSCAQRLATLSYTFAQSFSFNHLQAKSTCLKKRSKHRNSGRIPSLIGSLTPAHGRLSRNMINNFCKRIISHPVMSEYLLWSRRDWRVRRAPIGPEMELKESCLQDVQALKSVLKMFLMLCTNLLPKGPGWLFIRFGDATRL